MPWEPDHFRLFISHVSDYHKLASDLAGELRERYGVHRFVAHADIAPTEDWQNEIQTSLQSMDALVALLTPGFSESFWCNQEVGWALGRWSLAVSVRLGEGPRGFVGRFQAIPGGDGNFRRLARDVFQSLANNPGTAARVGVAALKLLQRARTWEEIRDYIAPALDMVTDVTEEALDSLQTAFNTNYHVRTSRYLGSIKNRIADSGREVPAPG